MKDKIYRQDAILMIQRHGVGCFDQEDFYPEEAERFVISMLEKLPFAEPEIIRCKDCKHYRFSDNRAFGFPVKRCEWTGFEDVDDDDFCSRAERKANG